MSEIWVPLGHLDEIELIDVHFFSKIWNLLWSLLQKIRKSEIVSFVRPLISLGDNKISRNIAPSHVYR